MIRKPGLQTASSIIDFPELPEFPKAVGADSDEFRKNVDAWHEKMKERWETVRDLLTDMDEALQQKVSDLEKKVDALSNKA
jgi:hypothetical protein